MKKNKFTTGLILALALSMTQAAFAADSSKESRVSRIEAQMTTLQQEIAQLELARNSGVIVSQKSGKHAVIIFGAIATYFVKVGKAMQVAPLTSGVLVEATGRSLGVVAVGEGAVVGYDLYTLVAALSNKKAELSLLQDQLDALAD